MIIDLKNKLVVKIKNKFIGNNDERVLKSLIQECNHSSSRLNKRILFAPGFNINQQFLNHDIIIASLLRSKGADINYLYGAEQFVCPFPFYGGPWTTGTETTDIQHLVSCENKAAKWFSLFSSIHHLKQYVSVKDVEKFQHTVNILSAESILTFNWKGIEIGHDVMNVVINLFLVSDIKLVPNSLHNLRNSLVNSLIYLTFFEKVIDEIKPDSIFSHDCFYYPWSYLQKLADRENIPFYNYYPFSSVKDGYVYTNNKAAMLLNTNDLWEKFKSKPLSEKENAFIENVLKEREKGKIFDQLQFRAFNNDLFQNISSFCNSKPTAVLYGNVVWDLAALDKEIVFKSIRVGFVEIIKYFISRPQYNLIIKSHPDEENPIIPVTIEQLETIISEEIGHFPDNVMLLNHKTEITVYDLIPLSKCTIVWTTSVGYESPILGTPTITLANTHYRNKGFTIDPGTKDELFIILPEILNGKKEDFVSLQTMELAKKYMYVFFNYLSYDYGIPALDLYGNVTSLTRRKSEEYLKNERLNYILDCIINQQKIEA